MRMALFQWQVTFHKVPQSVTLRYFLKSCQYMMGTYIKILDIIKQLASN